MKKTLTVSGHQVEIDLVGVREAAYRSTRARLEESLRDVSIKNREAIRDAFLTLLRRCPKANANDLWHHVVYRLYCEVLPRHRPQNPSQSWVRASGEALEEVLETIYTPVLKKRKIQIRALISRKNKREVLEEMGLSKKVGDSKLDVALYLDVGKDDWKIFGGVHVKTSLAERVSDDVPASRAMMKKGYFSPLWTLDVKSYPPPHGDLINRGELGTPGEPSEKRKYIEKHGEFSGCYSGNLRTSPSGKQTISGKRIFVIKLANQPDKFARDVIAAAKVWKKLTLAKR